jgi:hypothetical protein
MYLVLAIICLITGASFLDQPAIGFPILVGGLAFGIVALYDDYSGPGPTCSV